MSEINQLDQTSQILQNVDVSDIVSSLAIGVAEAQEKLDNNTVQQILRLSKEMIGDKSLIELGFVPAFYAFEYADISTSLNLIMKLNTDVNVGLTLALNNYRKLGYSNENIDLVEKDRSETYRSEYKSSNDFIIKSSSSKSVKVSDASITMNQTLGSLSMIDSFKSQLEQSSEIDRATHEVTSKHTVTENENNAWFEVHDSKGLVTLALPEMLNFQWGILKLTDYSTATEVRLNEDPDRNVDTEDPIIFMTGANFDDTVKAVIEATQDGNSSSRTYIDLYEYNRLANSFKIYFEWNKSTVNYNYEENGIGSDSSTTYGNNEEILLQVTRSSNLLAEKLRFLSLILKHDPTAHVNVTGYTDSSGKYNYNTKLSQERVDHVVGIITGMGASLNQINTEAKGEQVANNEEYGSLDQDNENAGKKNVKYRVVEIELVAAADYIVLGGSGFNYITATPEPDSDEPNKFIYKRIRGVSATNDLEFRYGDTFINLKNRFYDLSHFENQTELTDHFIMEIRGNTAYLLDKESQIKFTTLSDQSSKIRIKEDIEDTDSEENYRNEVEVYDSIDKNYYLQKDAEIINKPGTIAVNGTVDARYNSRFDISVEGRAAVSARLNDIPPPEKFIAYINEENSID